MYTQTYIEQMVAADIARAVLDDVLIARYRAQKVQTVQYSEPPLYLLGGPHRCPRLDELESRMR
jgi:hypothetical protein